MQSLAIFLCLAVSAMAATPLEQHGTLVQTPGSHSFVQRQGKGFQYTVATGHPGVVYPQTAGVYPHAYNYGAYPYNYGVHGANVFPTSGHVYQPTIASAPVATLAAKTGVVHNTVPIQYANYPYNTYGSYPYGYNAGHYYQPQVLSGVHTPASTKLTGTQAVYYTTAGVPMVGGQQWGFNHPIQTVQTVA